MILTQQECRFVKACVDTRNNYLDIGNQLTPDKEKEVMTPLIKFFCGIYGLTPETVWSPSMNYIKERFVTWAMPIIFKMHSENKYRHFLTKWILGDGNRAYTEMWGLIAWMKVDEYNEDKAVTVLNVK